MLTRKQHQLLIFINEHLNATGVAPSFDEMKEALGLKSKSGIHRLISGLEERGFIRRLAHRARALEVLRLPADIGVAENMRSEDKLDRFSPQVIKGGRDSASAPIIAPSELTGESPAASEVVLPFFGKIAAGTPIEALRDPTRHISVPPSMIGRGNHYCLEVEGDSMKNAGILDGDTVVIRRTDNAENGSIVVALVEGHEATLKRLRKHNNSVALEAENPAYETRIFGPDQVSVQGKLVGLLRKY
ncbi:MAG: transcriptional repressor LexA [Alphaproteobacteria bacterium]|nr:transcriptional repressor LexA [Alphaproteobacteria bacterium]